MRAAGAQPLQAGRGAAHVSPPPQVLRQGQNPAALLFSRPEGPAPRPRSVPEPSSPWAHWTYTDSAAGGNDPAAQKPRDPAAAAIFDLGPPQRRKPGNRMLAVGWDYNLKKEVPSGWYLFRGGCTL